MYVYSVHSDKKIFHSEQCVCVRKMSPENIKLAHMRDELVTKGYTECKFCGVLAKQYRKEKKALDDWCRVHYLRIIFQGGDLYVISRISVWKIVVSPKKNFILMHESGYQKARRSVTRISVSSMEFHLQRQYSSTLLKLLQYISSHEDWRAEARIRETMEQCVCKSTTKNQKRKRACAHSKQQRLEIRNVLELIEQVSATSESTAYAILISGDSSEKTERVH